MQEREYGIGETPGRGEYRCVYCDRDWQVTLDEGTDRLPPCQGCDGDVQYVHVGVAEDD